MKKVLSLVLALAMVISCVSMITVFAADELGKNILTEEESTFTGATDVPAGWAPFADTDLSVVADPANAENKVLQGVSRVNPSANNNWSSPMFKFGAKVKALMEANELSLAKVNFSMRVYVKNDAADAGKSVARMVIRNVANSSSVAEFGGSGLAGTAYNTWYTITASMDVAAAALPDFATTEWGLCVDSLQGTAPITVLYDDVSITVEELRAEVSNGDAENGTANWGVFAQGAGSIAQVEGGANNTAHAIKFTPGDKNPYQSIAFDLGPAIIQDKDLGYNGAGAGEYTLVFYAKTDSENVGEGKNTKFHVVLNSQDHRDAKEDGTMNGLEGDGYVASHMLATSPTISLSDQWQRFEVKFNVSEAYLKTIKAMKAAGSNNAYQLILRLDGATGSEELAFGPFSDGHPFAYYVDEVAIYAPGQEVPGQGGEGNEGGEATDNAPKGVTVKVTSADEGAGVYVRFSGYQGHMKDGKISVKIHNTGKSDVTLILESRKDDNTWTTIEAGKPVTIAPNKVADLTVSCPIEEGAKLPFMLIKIEGAKAGDSFTVYGFTAESIEANKPISTITTASNGKNASLDYGTTTTACPTGDAAPFTMVAVAAIACAALGLVVAAKKKKENA